MQTNVALITLGCDKNRVDSELMLGILEDRGYRIVSRLGQADVIIVNTCGFIEKAKQESIGAVLKAINQKKPNAKIIAAGCLAERHKNELFTNIPELDAVIGTRDYPDIADIVTNVLNGEKVFFETQRKFKYPEGARRLISTPDYSVYLKIAEGCDNRCAYCVIPRVRGRYRSRPIDKIIREAELLAANGAKELIVIAQDTTRYGIDIYGSLALPKLLNKLSEINGIRWIRLMYCYPDLIDEYLMHTIAENPCICKYIDIPLQHSSDKILKNMGRRHKKSDIIRIINRLRDTMPDLVIRTTFITGLPGETKEDFEDLLGFVQKMRFERVGVFAYSREEGTRAARMPKQVPGHLKRLRYNRIMRVQQKISLELNSMLEGKILNVLVEGYDNTARMYFGRSYREAPEVDGLIYFYSMGKHLPGSFVNVKILRGCEYDLIGEIYHEPGE